MHAFLTEKNGGSGERGSEESLLPLIAMMESETTQWTWGSAAMAYLEFICLMKPFPDKNEQVALMAAEVFLNLNGKALSLTEAEAMQLVRDVREGRLRGEALSNALNGKIKAISQ